MATPISLKDGAIVLTDNDGANTLTLGLEDGNLSFTLPRPHEHSPDRGAAGVIIDGAFEPIPFSMTLDVVTLLGSAGVAEVVLRTESTWDFGKLDTAAGSYSGKTATLQDVSSDVGVFQMVVTYTNPTSAAVENLYFFDCVATYDFSEGLPSKTTISGVSYQTAQNFLANID